VESTEGIEVIAGLEYLFFIIFRCGFIYLSFREWGHFFLKGDTNAFDSS